MGKPGNLALKRPPEPNLHASEPIGTVRQMYDGALTPELAVNTFRNIERLFPARRIARSSRPLPLPRAEIALDAVRFTDRGREYGLEELLARERVAGLLVLQDGRIRHEHYRLGNTERTRWMSMSVAKSITSTLVGAALHERHIGSLDDPLPRYVPALAGCAYAASSVRDVLMMASGVRWNETYTDPRSDRRRLLEAQIAQRPGVALALMASLPRAAPPGTVNLYSTGETQVVGEVLRGAVGRPLADYLHERIWNRVGMEADATWWLDSPEGIEIAGSGISATLRDYGRFGLFLLADGVAGGERILPEGWVAEATRARALRDGSRPDCGYLWWTAETADARRDHAFEAVGIFGQHLYVNPAARVVIVLWRANPLPRDPDAIEPAAFFDAVVAFLRREPGEPG